MNKLVLTAAIAAMTIAPFIMSSGASAVGTCDIGYTGPDSENNCVLVETFTCEIDNENTITIYNENKQNVATGTASGPNATSGSASNSNGATFNVEIINDYEDTVCEVVTTVPATPTPETPVVVTPEPTPEVLGATVTALPVTSSVSDVMQVTLIAIASAVAGLSIMYRLIARMSNDKK